MLISTSGVMITCVITLNYLPKVRKLFVDSFLKFSAIFGIDVSLLAVGIADIAIKVDIFSTEFSRGNPEKVYQKIIFIRSMEQLLTKGF